MKICPKCQRGVEALTYDHRIPKWLLKRMHYFGFNFLTEGKLKKHNLEMLRQMVCINCNLSKGGKIDWQDPLVRQFMIEFINAIKKELGL